MKIVERLEKIATEHEEKARGIRMALDVIHTIAQSNGHAMLKAAIKIREHAGHGTPKRTYKKRHTKNGHVLASNGNGMTPAIMTFLKQHPGSTMPETWDGIQGKYETSSKKPRSLMGVLMRNMWHGKKLIRHGDKFSLPEAKQ